MGPLAWPAGIGQNRQSCISLRDVVVHEAAGAWEEPGPGPGPALVHPGPAVPAAAKVLVQIGEGRTGAVSMGEAHAAAAALTSHEPGIWRPLVS